MLKPRVAKRIAGSLHGLAQADELDFNKSPKLMEIYYENLRKGRHIYVDDIITCGWSDCWSTYKDLVLRYGEKGPIYLDCEDAACAHAGYMSAIGNKGIYVGLVPGKRISHAIMGVDLQAREEDLSSVAGPKGDKQTDIVIVDPARWYGMRETKYEKVYWRKLC